MPFLSIDDYKLQIKQDIQTIITDDDVDVTAQAELTAQTEMESYLNQRFDVAAIFAATGTARNAMLVTYLIDMALYHIHCRINPRQIPDIRLTRYENAIKWLTMVASGKITPDLPRLTNTDGNVQTDFRFGSNTKFSSEY